MPFPQYKYLFTNIYISKKSDSISDIASRNSSKVKQTQLRLED